MHHTSPSLPTYHTGVLEPGKQYVAYHRLSLLLSASCMRWQILPQGLSASHQASLSTLVNCLCTIVADSSSGSDDIPDIAVRQFRNKPLRSRMFCG